LIPFRNSKGTKQITPQQDEEYQPESDYSPNPDLEYELSYVLDGLFDLLDKYTEGDTKQLRTHETFKGNSEKGKYLRIVPQPS